MLTDDEAKRIVEHYAEPLTQCWIAAFRDYQDQYLNTRHLHSPRTRASLLHDHCIHHVRQNLSELPGVVIPQPLRGLFVVSLGGEPVELDGALLVKFKKLNKSLLTSNIVTGQSSNFNNQVSFVNATQGELFGENHWVRPTGHTHLNIGYLPDVTWSGVQGIFATQPNGNRSIRWYLEMPRAAGTVSEPIIEMPITIIDRQPARIKAKGTKTASRNVVKKASKE